MSFLEDEIDGQYQKKKCNEVVGFQGFSLKENGSEYHKYHEGDNLLDYFELHKRKGTSGTWKPILLAGTWAQYSKNAIAQLKSITPKSPQLETSLLPLPNLRWPYQARVIKLLDITSSNIVINPFPISYLNLKFLPLSFSTKLSLLLTL